MLDHDSHSVLSPDALPAAEPEDTASTEFLLNRSQIFEAVNDLATLVAQTTTEQEFFRITADWMKGITGALITTISKYEPETRVMRMKYFATTSGFLLRINKLAGRHIAKIPYKVTPVLEQHMLNNTAIKLEDLYDLFLRNLPRSVCNLIQRRMGISCAYGLTLVDGDQLIGSACVVLPEGSKPLPLEGAVTLAHMVSASMIRASTRQEIARYQGELRELASEVSLAEERERRRIASALHDHVIQSLALAQIKLEGLEESKGTEQVVSLLEESIHSIRDLTFELSPPVLYEFGLEAAVEWLAEKLTRDHNIFFDVRQSAHSPALKEDAKVMLFQVVRELLINVVKHAKATHATVVFETNDKDYTIQVYDDGQGALPAGQEGPHRATNGFGLFNIKEQLGRIGGSLKLDCRVGGGCHVGVRIPLVHVELQREEDGTGANPDS